MTSLYRERARVWAEGLGLMKKREIPTFGLESITKAGNRLQIELAQTRFALPLVHLDFPQVEEAAIGWFDPNPLKNPQIDQAATIAMEGMLQVLNPKVVVMTNSSKSEHFIKEAVKNLPKGTRLIVLPSGSEEKEKKNITDRSEGSLTRYKPVTGTVKLMGYPKKEDGQVDYLTLKELQKLCPNGKGLVIVDDVYTTGATNKAMELVLGLNEQSKHHIAVIAIEKQYDGKTGAYRENKLPKNLHAAFNLTEFVGLDKLPIEIDRLYAFDKENIPKALVDDDQV